MVRTAFPYSAMHVVAEDARHLVHNRCRKRKVRDGTRAIAACGNKGGERHGRGVACSFTAFDTWLAIELLNRGFKAGKVV